MQQPLLTVDEISLTPPRLDDAEDWAAAQDDECARWFDWPGRPPVERCREHLANVTAADDPDSYTWAIRTPTGFAGGIDLKLDEGAWNISYFVHPDHRGRHIARRALRAVTDWALTRRGLPAVSTRVHTDNIASQKVLVAAGFTRTGTVDNPEANHQDFTYERHR
ncbi:GNAT family N-acetyltransferase [Luteococcus sp. H138]|uniref:GNAT family N-acetyltransferase n=1 Tax=unclassified Luteococcus TaxID=2639923 RepID=UPI00313CBAC7